MALFVHLATQKDAGSIRRSGIARLRRWDSQAHGIFAMPVMCWRSVKMQWGVTVVAALVGVFHVGVMFLELSGPHNAGRTGPGTGTLSILSWIVAIGVSVVVLLVAAAASAWMRLGTRGDSDSD
jgi:protein-S-isoprenylcysteine O-methyltransferase Ste14